MPKNICKYLTIEDLLKFCKQSNMGKFSASEAGGPIIIQSFGEVSTSDTTTAGLTPCTLMACHTELNLNKSYIADDVAEKALASFSNRPILGYEHQTDNGEWVFWDHRTEIQEDENEECRVQYLERPIGIIPESCNAHIEYDKDNKKNYVVVNGYLYDDYGNRAVDIIKANDGKVSVSVEIAVNEMSFNAKEGYLCIEDLTFMAVTCLGKTPDGTIVRPGMEGSNLKLDNFSQKQNSVFANQDTTNLIKVLEKLNTTLENFDKKNSTKGVEKNMKSEELLAKYGKVAEDVTFETKGLSDEELEAKFAEAFEEASEEEKVEVEESASEDGDVEDAVEEPIVTEDEACGGKKKKKCSVDEDGNMSVAFEISHEDTRYALYNLLGVYDEEDNEWYMIDSVYDSYFIMRGWCNNQLYKQAYKVDGDNVAFDGDREQVFEMILSQAEKDAIESLRSDYATLEAQYNELKTFKDDYDATQTKTQKDEIFAKAEYECLVENEDFKKLVEDAEKYSVDEISTKADLLFAAYVKANGTFSVKPVEKPNTIGVPFQQTNKHKDAYGGLFHDFKEKHGK